MIHTRVNHGTWSHAGKRNPHCEACRLGIGGEEHDMSAQPERCEGSCQSSRYGTRRCSLPKHHEGDCDYTVKGPFDKPWEMGHSAPPAEPATDLQLEIAANTCRAVDALYGDPPPEAQEASPQEARESDMPTSEQAETAANTAHLYDSTSVGTDVEARREMDLKETPEGKFLTETMRRLFPNGITDECKTCHLAPAPIIMEIAQESMKAYAAHEHKLRLAAEQDVENWRNTYQLLSVRCAAAESRLAQIEKERSIEGICDTTDWPHLMSDGTGRKRPHAKCDSCTNWRVK